MFKILFLIFSLLLISCEDKKTESSEKLVTTPNICPVQNPDLEESPINFNGIDSISEITQNSVILHWTASNEISRYLIFKHESSSPSSYREIIKTVAGNKNQVKLNRLKPNTEYHFIVRSIDKNGFLNTNQNIISFKTKDWPSYVNQKSVKLNGAQSIAIGPSSIFSHKKKMTISFWFKTSTKVDESRLFTFHKSSDASTALSFGVEKENVKIVYSDNDEEVKAVYSDFHYYNNDWNHIVIVSNNKLISLYINGKRSIHHRAKLLLPFGDHKAHIGAFTGINKAFQGYIDEFSFYDTALAQNQIKDIYANGKATNLQSYNSAKFLKNWYRLGDDLNDSSTNIKDIISNNNGVPLNLEENDFVLISP